MSTVDLVQSLAILGKQYCPVAYPDSGYKHIKVADFEQLWNLKLAVDAFIEADGCAGTGAVGQRLKQAWEALQDE